MARDKLTTYSNTMELNLSLSVDNLLADKWEPLAPYHNMLNYTVPGGVNSQIYLTDPVVATASNWLNYEKVYTDSLKISKMEKLMSKI